MIKTIPTIPTTPNGLADGDMWCDPNDGNAVKFVSSFGDFEYDPEDYEYDDCAYDDDLEEDE